MRGTLLLCAALAWLAVAVITLSDHAGLLEWSAFAAGVGVLLTVWQLWRRAEAEHQRFKYLLDAMHAGIVLYDRDDRVLLVNADFKRLYGLSDADIAPGVSFETLLRQRVMDGRIPEAVGNEQAWIAERVAQHRRSDGTGILRRIAHDRWRRITEQRLPDGSLLSFSIDVTELIEQQAALEATRKEAERTHRLLDEAIEAMPAAVEIYDGEDRLVMFNRRMVDLYPHMADASLLGETFSTLVGRALAQQKVPDAVGREAAWLAQRLAERGRRAEPLLQRAGDGRWTHIYETPMPGGGLVTVRLDANEIVRQRDELLHARDAADASRAVLHDALEAMPAGIEVYDAQDRLVIFNRRLAQMYPHVAEQMSLGQSFEVLVRRSLGLGMVPEAIGGEEAWLAQRLEQRRQALGDAPRLQHTHDGRWVHIYETRGQGGSIVGVRLDVSDLVRQREQLDAANAALERLSATDPLTGLANRRRFDAALAEELQRAQRHGSTLALLMADIDHFKRFNDHRGHPEGDRALRAVSALLAQQARRPGELVARIGGEEFALLLPHADAATALAVAERCRQALVTLALAHGDSPTAPHVTLSIGVALWRRGDDAQTLVARADAALYAAKAAGRARCLMADEDAP
jgi:diguanylate cyclase (GGDEF)-like protein/PAS domain S-box-containing protein